MPAHSNTHDFAPTASLAALKTRASLLRKLRTFFDERGFLEVETPLLSPEVIPELHIEPIAGDGHRAEGVVGSPHLSSIASPQWLQASPELHMKCLLAAGATAIYQVTRSFRGGERGPLHNPEFTIVEWYRAGDDLRAGMDLLDALAQSLLKTPPAIRTTYGDAFLLHFQLDPHSATPDQLAKAAASAKIAVPDGMQAADRDEWLNLLLATRIEPQLGREAPEILYHYPASQSSLAKVVPTAAGYQVAERFELYYRGIEVANGFHELADAAELRRRLEAVNAARIAAGRRALPMPESLLSSMAHGLPDCTGCALGFDRLVMLAIGAKSIDDVIAFPVESKST